MTKSTWDNEVALGLLKHNWRSKTAQEISDLIYEKTGIFVTRNAVIGKALRIGLPQKGSDISYKKPANAGNWNGQSPKATMEGTLHVPMSDRLRAMADLDTKMLADDLTNLGQFSCRWPTPKGWCRNQQLPGDCFCEEHQRQGRYEMKKRSEKQLLQGMNTKPTYIADPSVLEESLNLEGEK